MTATKAVQNQDVLTDNQDFIGVFASNAKCRLEVAMSYNEINNHQEQKYYNKSKGCSVKAQEDNLFDYKSWLKKKHHCNNG
ncbi:hypothetical protein [Flavobacterium limnophilum]|uniref:hypothetical protein n=1 Tax=Flavobacterium limnophilum TaxID=3003262 RepID=UPI0022AC740A|nr:hypothetical protein [Flavobacterium limnophilum]